MASMDDPEKAMKRSREMVEHRRLQERITQVETRLALAVEEATDISSTLSSHKGRFDALSEERRTLDPAEKKTFWDFTKSLDSLKREIEALEESKQIADANVYELGRELGELREVQRQYLRGEDDPPQGKHH